MALSIGELVGYVKLDTTGVAKGAAVTRAEMSTLGRTMDTTASKGGKFSALGGAVKSVGLALGGLGLAKVAGDAVSLEASFSKTMAQMQASTGATGKQMDSMKSLAMKMGADTSFSANEAAGAMLELAKAGVRTSDIMGGGLKGTLTLAAAGGTDLGTAATIASNAMNTFALKGKDMGSIAAALAGGANASSASVESLGEALSQVGPGAKNAGLSLQETVATLAAFDSAGVKGSDAGTSLKTMLANLQPPTARAATAMAEVGLYSKKTGSAFVKANGQFKSMTQIAGLLHDKLGGLSEAQRSQALTQIFGSDASRAATVLMNEGSKGLAKYIKATKDQGAAQKMANANMSGTSGALERMKGSIETAELALGQALAPAVQAGAGAVGALATGLASLVGFLSDNKPVAIALGVAIGGLTAVTLAFNAAMAVQTAGGLAAWVAQTKIASAVTKVWTAVQWAFNAAMSANPIMLVVIGLAALAVALYIAWKKSATFRAIVTGAFEGVKKVAGAVLDWLKGAVSGAIDFVRKHWQLIVAILGGPIAAAAILVTKHFGQIKSAGAMVVSWIAAIPGKLGALAGKFGAAGKGLLQDFIDGMKNAAGVIQGIAGNVWNAVRGLLNGAIDKINAALVFSIDKGPVHLSVNPPDIPHLRTGGRTRANSPGMAWIGDANEPESVLRDSQLRVLIREAVAQATAARKDSGEGAVFNVTAAPGESAEVTAERTWYKLHTRGTL